VAVNINLMCQNVVVNCEQSLADGQATCLHVALSVLFLYDVSRYVKHDDVALNYIVRNDIIH